MNGHGEFSHYRRHAGIATWTAPAMRLNIKQRDAIVETFIEVFGKGEIRLFGSRLDDNRKGGDIDLYVIPASRNHLAENRLIFLARLKRRIGDQKIDLVIAGSEPRPIDLLARQQGVILCQRY